VSNHRAVSSPAGMLLANEGFLARKKREKAEKQVRKAKELELEELEPAAEPEPTVHPNPVEKTELAVGIGEIPPL
jgi:hypothetical protein